MCIRDRAKDGVEDVVSRYGAIAVAGMDTLAETALRRSNEGATSAEKRVISLVNAHVSVILS